MAESEEGVDKARLKQPASVLFVCAMNAIRSPMAEYLTRHHFGDRIYVESAGVQAGVRDSFAEAVMAEAGMPLGAHTPSTLDDLSDSYFDLIVTLSPEAHHRALEMTRSQAVDIEYWPTFDPSSVAGNREQVMAAYRQLRDTLDKRIRARFADD
ncbi:MAG: low molecular weight phosphatase family protein [Nitratireductor sp.]|nr:low molecular weight phosphatase family protein [Nitratireductor sp.]